MTPFTLSQLTAQLGGELIGNDIAITAIAPAARAQACPGQRRYQSQQNHPRQAQPRRQPRQTGGLRRDSHQPQLEPEQRAAKRRPVRRTFQQKQGD